MPPLKNQNKSNIQIIQYILVQIIDKLQKFNTFSIYSLFNQNIYRMKRVPIYIAYDTFYKIKKMTKVMKINFTGEKTGQGTLTYEGSTYDCLGKAGHKYPKDSTINVKDKDHNHFSKEFNCQLPWAILLDGNRGVYIHQDVTTGDLSHGNTHGCINLLPGDAEGVYNALTGKTRVLITYKW